MRFGDRVRAERELRGWSLQELADRASVAARSKCPRVTIEKIEARSAEKSKWSGAIAEALGVDHDWLLSGKGAKTAAPSIDRRLRLLPAEISEALQQQFDVLIDNELKNLAKRQPR